MDTSERRAADKLVQAHRKRGGEDWVYVHVDVQASRKTNFQRRMGFAIRATDERLDSAREAPTSD